MVSGKSRVGDEHDRHRNNPQYRVEEVRNASLGDNWGTMIQGAHSPKILTGTVTKSNARDQINVHGGKVKIYLSSDSRPPEMTLQRMGIARALSRVLSKIKSRPPPSEEPSSSTEDVVGRDLQHQDDSRAGRSESMEIDTSPSGSSFQEQETRFGKEREGITRTLPNRQAGLSLLPLDKLDPGSLGFSDSSNPIPAEIYVGSMLGYGLGLACWSTKPHSGDAGPNPGDIGTFSSQDGFTKIFNLWSDEQSIRQTAGTLTPPGSYQSPGKRVDNVKRARLTRGEIVKPLPGVKGCAIHRPDYTDIGSFEICCAAQRGAALILTSAADQQDLDDCLALRGHIIAHAELLYRHANAVRCLGHDESLYILTGSVKSESCGLVAFGEPMAPNDLPVVLENSSCQGQLVTSWVWGNTGTANTQLSNPCSNGVNDQALFLRGFKLDFSSSFRFNLKGPSSGGDENVEGEGGGNGGRRTTGGGQGGPSGSGEMGGSSSSAGSRSNSGQGGGGFGTSRASQSQFGGAEGRSSGRGLSPDGANFPSGEWSSFRSLYDSYHGQGGVYDSGRQYAAVSAAPRKAVHLQSFPDSPRWRSCHPCDIINEHLLEVTGASFALSHDDDWLPFLKGVSIWEREPKVEHPSPPTLDDSAWVYVHQGVAYLETGLRASTDAAHPSDNSSSWLNEIEDLKEGEPSGTKWNSDVPTPNHPGTQTTRSGFFGSESDTGTEFEGSSPNPMHALIIGIDDYSLTTGFKPLKAAVSDAQQFWDWLVTELKVHPSSIRKLCNEAATRKAIIKAFQDLATSPDVKLGDPIVIYYAGHGSRSPAPREWHWDSPKIELIIPWDYNHADGPNRTVQGIPDCTIGHLLKNIALNKGDNITVITDCCYSGSGTRSDEDDSQTRGGYYNGELPADLDENLFLDIGSRGTRRGGTDSQSHILLAACSQYEEAREEQGSGNFTRVLLRALSGVSPMEITYEDLIQRMELLARQTPRCEGFFRSRFLFDKKVPNTKALYDVVLKGNKATISAGAVHGMEPGTKLGLWKSRADIQKRTCVEVEVTHNDNVLTYETIVTYIPRTEIIGPMVAQILGKPKPKLSIYCPPEVTRLKCFKTVFSTDGRRVLPPVTFVNTKGLATLGLECLERDNQVIGFELLNPTEAKQKIHHVIRTTADELYDALSHIATYYRHKDRKTSKPPGLTDQGSKDVMFSPKFTLDAFILELSERGSVPRQENRHVEGLGIKVTVCDQTKEDCYGFCINNHSDFDVFPYIFYFDSSNFSITAVYQPSAEALFEDAPLKKGGSFRIGYENSVTPPQMFTIGDSKADLELGYLRVYVSRKYIDLSFMQQEGLESARRAHIPSESDTPFCDCITIPVIMERGNWSPPKHMVGIIGSKGNGKHTFLTELFKSLYGNPIPKPSFENTHIKEYSITFPECRAFSLVDLPEIQDPEKVLDHISALQATLSYLTKAYQQGSQFLSLIWCYNISTSLSKVDYMNLQLFSNLCGKAMFKNVVVLTTNWNKGIGLDMPIGSRAIDSTDSHLTRYENNEEQIMDSPNICKPLKDGGARFERFGVFRSPATRDSHPALTVIKTPFELVKSVLENDPQPLQAQKEACTTRILVKTTAGKMFQAKIEEMIKKRAEEILGFERETKGMRGGEKDWEEVQTELTDAREDIIRWNQTLEEIGMVDSVFI